MLFRTCINNIKIHFNKGYINENFEKRYLFLICRPSISRIGLSGLRINRQDKNLTAWNAICFVDTVVKLVKSPAGKKSLKGILENETPEKDDNSTDSQNKNLRKFH